MSNTQYDAYHDSFGILPAIQPAPVRTVKGIGGRQTAYGTVLIKIPLTSLGLLIDVELLVIKDDVYTPLILREVLTNNLDLSIQEKCFTFEGNIEPLSMEDYCLTYKWAPDDRNLWSKPQPTYSNAPSPTPFRHPQAEWSNKLQRTARFAKKRMLRQRYSS